MTETNDTTTKSGTARRLKVVLAVILSVIVVWSVGWFAIATALERQMDMAMGALDREGMQVDCARRTIGGYPFRIEVRCGPNSGIGDGEQSVEIAGLSAVGQIYQPNHLIVEAKAPASWRLRDTAVSFDWSLAQMSVGLNLEKFSHPSLARIDVVADDVAIAPPGQAHPAVTADRLQLHARQNPDRPGTADVALELDALGLAGGIGPLDFDLLAHIEQGARLFDGHPEVLEAALSVDGLPVEIASFTIAAEDAIVAITGDATLRRDGLIDGEFDVAITGSKVPYLDQVLEPQAAASWAEFLKNVLAYGQDTTVADQPAKAFKVSIKDGAVRAGLVPLGQIPALAFARR